MRWDMATSASIGEPITNVKASHRTALHLVLRFQGLADSFALCDAANPRFEFVSHGLEVCAPDGDDLFHRWRR